MKTPPLMNPPKPKPPGPPPLPVAGHRVQAVFAEAVEIADAAARENWILAALPGELALQAQVRGLLRAHAAAGDFLADTLISPELEAEMARLKPEEAGDRIGPYKLLQQLGEGGFGVVWMAEQEQPVRRRVALKIIKLGMDTKEVIARFEQERQALAMMEHANIARVLDAGATPHGRPYFAMELVRGIKITEFCDQNHLSTRERLGLFIQVCHALQHAHQKGIIHRDLKPSNIMVTLHDGVPVPKVIDFGVAKAMQQRLTERTLFTQFSQMIGTPLYMSPEQAEMSGLDIDTRSDIYSLGVLLYELLAGRTPFDADEMARRGLDEMRHMIREQEPPRPSTALGTMAQDAQTTVAASRGSDLPKLLGLLRGDLDWIVMKAMEKDRARRYESASAFAMDLQRHLTNEPVLARPASRLYRFQRLVRRNKAAFAATAIVALTLLVSTAVAVWQAVRLERVAREAANSALDANRHLASLKEMAPALLAQAHSLVVQDRFGEAIEKLDQARKLQPGDREIMRARANLLQAQFHFADAAEAYREILRLSPHDARADRQAALCERLRVLSSPTGGKPSRENLAELYQAMSADQRPAAEILPVARQLGEEMNVRLGYWRERLRDLPLPAGLTLEQCLTMRPDSLLRLDLTDSGIADLRPLAGMPLGALVLSGSRNVVDLAPLRDLPLRELDLTGTDVADLAPLRSLLSLESLRLGRGPVNNLAPLRELGLRSLVLVKLNVTDLTPLAGMPLRELFCQELGVSNYAALEGMALEKLVLHKMRFENLAVLRDMPLRVLVLSDCTAVRGLRALADFPNLETVVLPWEMQAIPENELEAVAALRDRPALRQLASEYLLAGGNPLTTIGGKDEFFRRWDETFAWKVPLIRQGAKCEVAVTRNGEAALRLTGEGLRDLSGLKELTMIDGRPLRELTLKGTTVTDLAPLAGLQLRRLEIDGGKLENLAPLAVYQAEGHPIEELVLRRLPVTDLSPLAKLRLRKLDLYGSEVVNLSPLAAWKAEGHPIRELSLHRTPVSDLRPLAGLPLTWLDLEYSEVSDLSPLAGMPLKFLRATDAPIRDLQPLAGMKELTDLGLGGTQVTDITPLKGLPIRILQLNKLTLPDLEPLRGMPLDQLLASELTTKDLEPLRGSSITNLHLGSSKFGSIEPLADCRALINLNLAGTTVEDLLPLAGLKLRELHVGHARVRNLVPVRGMPLRVLTVDNCPLEDASGLLEFATLEQLTITRTVPGVSKLRNHPRLQFISSRWDSSKARPANTVQEYWADWDSRNRVAK